MKASRIVFALVMIAGGGTSAAHATTTCLNTYYQCLNSSWNTSGFERFAADLECGTEYLGCLRRKA